MLSLCIHCESTRLWGGQLFQDSVSGGSDGTVRVWDLATGKEVARWTGDYAVIACTVLSGQPFKMAVGQQHGQPYLLELRGQKNTT